MLIENVLEVNTSNVDHDNVVDCDERTLLQKSAISSIISDPEQFSSSDQDGKTSVVLPRPINNQN